MQLNEDFGVSPGKLEELKGRIVRLGVDLKKIEETFSRGGGKGGQKINKTSNRVQLSYPPLDLRVTCQRERKRSLNRFLALRELVDQVGVVGLVRQVVKAGAVGKGEEKSRWNCAGNHREGVGSDSARGIGRRIVSHADLRRARWTT